MRDSYRVTKIRSSTCARGFSRRISLPKKTECYPQHMTHGSRTGSAWKAPRIFFSVSHCTMYPCTSWSCAVRYRAIISIRGITDVSSFHTVSTSRKLARFTLAAGWQLAPKKHRKTSRPVITVAPVLSSHYQRALAQRINLIRFSGWSV